MAVRGPGPFVIPFLLAVAPAFAQTATVSVSAGSLGPRIPADFVGVSLELEHDGFLGTRAAPKPVFVQLLRNLGGGVLRLGGRSQDDECWGSHPGADCRGTIDAADLEDYFDAAGRIGWPVILGLNLAQDSPSSVVSEVEEAVEPAARRGRLLGLEIGNEPDLYAKHHRRAADYTEDAYLRELGSFADALRARRLRMPLAGPAVCCSWSRDPGALVDGLLPAGLGLATVHRYGLNGCGKKRAAPTAEQLLDPSVMDGLRAAATAWSSAASRRGLGARLDETNSVSCGGAAGVSDRFASALWALDWMFTAAEAGLSGVNFHNGEFPGARYAFFRAGPQGGEIKPLYYAMYLFARGASGAQLLPVRDDSRAVAAHAVRRCPECPVKVFLINRDPRARITVRVEAGPAAGAAALTRLQAAGLDADETTISLGGAAFNPKTGRLGTETLVPVQPREAGYLVDLAPASAAVLTINGPRYRSLE